MTTFLLPGEKELFFLINGAHTPFMDGVMWLYSGMEIWMPLAVALLFTATYKKSWREWAVILLSFVVLALVCDFVSAGLLKPLVQRPRPTGFPGVAEFVRILGERKIDSGSYGFISGHSTQCFAIAMFSSLIFRKRLYAGVAFSWALVMGYSRIYLGAHFPGDVLGGMVAGILLAYGVYKLYRLIVAAGAKKGIFRPTVYTDDRIRDFSLGIIGYIILFSLLSPWLIPLLK